MATAQDLLKAQTPTDLDSIKGWFFSSDRRMFAWLLQHQTDQGERGELVELGCYLGKSAVLIGDFVGADETFTVLDLFESAAPDAENTREMSLSYSTLAEDAFKDNYRKFHADLPEVVKGPSSEIVDHVKPGSCRFIHVDASHLYEHVAIDVDSARSLLSENGVVAFDDYRSEHCPGVAAAVWEAVFAKGLKPICVTESKLYGTWGDPEPLREAIQAWLTKDPLGFVETHYIADQPVLRTKIQLPRPPAAKSTPKPAVVAAVSPTHPPRTGVRKMAKDWLPDSVHRAISDQLQKRR
ncbi:hypothetical protein VV02_03915 [Luteipulveratus mongoliensis]|uniref:Methyltransferase n=2 Tax=Luteipulveratus mongoliensis TaxID=571913 RepID=A0A0K1JPT5_9MICO|nr:hypothetical protein VV02_03915 [Luteipulveratus mongoliensis]